MQHPAGLRPFRKRLRYDPQLYLELRYCNSDGRTLPHSEFLSWSDWDRAAALAFMLEESQRCTMCGTAPWEWDPEQGGDRHAYEPVVHIDPGCAMRDSAAEDTPKQHGHTVVLAPTSGSAAYFRLKRAAESYERGDQE